MVVVFLQLGTETLPIAEKMVFSVRRVMPTVKIIQHTDMVTPAIVDDVVRRPWDGLKLMTYRLEHLAAMPEQETLILDTDIWMQRDVSGVFKDKEFDVALTKREGSLMWRGLDIAKAMPYNTGVMFSRKARFWAKAHAWCCKAQEEIQDWFGDQMAVRGVADQFNVLELPCDVYNYTPSAKDEDVSSRSIVHYKGAAGRKQWMLERC